MIRFERDHFLKRIWDYRPGEGVLFVEPTQGGKTHLAFQLLQHTDHLRPPVAMVMKPRDATPAEWTRRLGWREVPAWPPPRRRFWEPAAPGYTLWPPHTLGLDRASVDATNDNLEQQFRRCLLDAYKRGDQVVFCDEILGLVEELNLSKELSMLWTRGAGMGAGLWSATQRPAGTRAGGGIPGHAFNMPTHLFLGLDLNQANRQRFGEIGGVDPRYVSEVVGQLRMHQVETPHGTASVSDKLYIDKRGNHLGPYMAIIGP
jgi:hypothetical protein